MDRYLNNCYKAAQAAASKAAASSLTANRELCDSVSGGRSVILLLFLLQGWVLGGKEGGQMKDYGGGLSRAGWVLEPGFLSQSSGLSANSTITQRRVLNRIIAL